MNRFTPRRGFSMIEMMVAISVTGVLTVVAASWMHQSLKFASAMKQRQRVHQTLLRLASELRDDVRQSEALSMEGDDRLVIHRADGKRIIYSIATDTITVEHPGAGQPPIQNQFVLSTAATAIWDTSEMPDWISLIVIRGREGVPTMPPDRDEPSAADSSSGPIDLHVRVGPHRWQGVLATERSKEPNQEGEK